MSEADRVFARMTKPSPRSTSKDNEVLHVASRQRGAAASQSRVVEVVHRRSDRLTSPAEPARRPGSSAYAASWPDGFNVRPAPSPPAAASPEAPEPAPLVGHFMPGWDPLLPPVQPVEAAADLRLSIDRRPRTAKPERPKETPRSTKRAFADPFAADDTGSNCIRCGYLVSPARERRGLLTCMQCR
jgi:hypothetical protein